MRALQCGPTLRRRCSSLLLSLVLMLLAATHRPCQASDLETDMRAGIRAAKVLFEKCTLQSSVAIANPFDESKTNIGRFTLHDGRYFLETSVDAKTHIETVKGINPRYAFAVAKGHGQKNYSLLKVFSKAENGSHSTCYNRRHGGYDGLVPISQLRCRRMAVVE